MKHFILLSVLMLPLASYAKTKVVQVELVKNGTETIHVKDGDSQIYIRDFLDYSDPRPEERMSHSIAELKIEKESFVFSFGNGQKILRLADVDRANSTPNKTISENKVPVKIFENKVKSKFRATLCTHAGCIPFPHFEEYNYQLVEFETIEGESVCYNENVIEDLARLSIGKCPKK